MKARSSSPVSRLLRAPRWIGGPRYVGMPIVEDLKALGSRKDQRLMLSMRRDGGALFWAVPAESMVLCNFLREEKFGDGTTIVLNAARNESDRFHMQSNVLPTPEEVYACEAEDLKLAVSSENGLGLILAQPGNFPPRWELDRSLITSFAEAGRSEQFLPGFMLVGDGVLNIHRTTETYLNSWPGSFKVTGSDLEWSGQPKEYFSKLAMKGFFFNWNDIIHRFGEENGGVFDLLTKWRNWDVLWTEMFPAVETGSLEKMLFPPRPEIHDDMLSHSKINDVLEAIALAHREKGPAGAKTLVLNYDAHTDLGYDPCEFLHDGNWALWAQRRGLARVVHIPSRYIDDGASTKVRCSEKNWNTPPRRASLLSEIGAILKAEEIAEIALTVDFDAFSLRQSTGQGTHLDRRPVYHMTVEEVRNDLHALKEFLYGAGIRLHRILPCSSRNFLNLPKREQVSDYVGNVMKAIRDTFQDDHLP